MDLTCLLLTSDAALLDVVRTTFGAAGVGLELRADAASAIELAGRRQMEQVVNAHLGEASLDRKKPEALKVEAIRTNGDSTAPGGKFLP